MAKNSKSISIDGALKRDRKVEAERAQLSFFSAVSSLSEQRVDGKLTEVWQVA